jgi:hypothetical protein
MSWSCRISLYPRYLEASSLIVKKGKNDEHKFIGEILEKWVGRVSNHGLGLCRRSSCPFLKSAVLDNVGESPSHHYHHPHHLMGLWKIASEFVGIPITRMNCLPLVHLPFASESRCLYPPSQCHAQFLSSLKLVGELFLGKGVIFATPVSPRFIVRCHFEDIVCSWR